MTFMEHATSVINEAKKIEVKCLDTPSEIVKKYKFNEITVHVGMTRSELEKMTREEAQKRNYDFYMGYSGYDDFPETNDREEADLL